MKKEQMFKMQKPNGDIVKVFHYDIKKKIRKGWDLLEIEEYEEYEEKLKSEDDDDDDFDDDDNFEIDDDDDDDFEMEEMKKFIIGDNDDDDDEELVVNGDENDNGKEAYLNIQKVEDTNAYKMSIEKLVKKIQKYLTDFHYETEGWIFGEDVEISYFEHNLIGEIAELFGIKSEVLDYEI